MNSLAVEGKYPCPICLDSSLIRVDVENETGKCEKCGNTFFCLLCYYCNNMIYYRQKIHIDGYIIKCPYNICRMLNCTLLCDGCGKRLHLRKVYSEGTPISCVHCMKIIKKIKCPFLECNEKPIPLNPDYAVGSLLPCKGLQTSFQKIKCYGCSRNYVWYHNKNKRFIEGQTIKCPYTDCQRKFNIVNCKKCYGLTIFTGGHLYIGRKITCQLKGCGNVFNLCFCPTCYSIQYFDGRTIEGEDITCYKCGELFQFINCYKCFEAQFWKKSSNSLYSPGQKVICKYCDTSFIKLKCPHCGELIVFPKSVIHLGKKYNCLSCKKSFGYFYCSQCEHPRIEKYEVNGGAIPWKCKQCNNYMPSLQCAYCYSYGIGDLKQIKPECIIICPELDCGKKYYYNKCPLCSRDYTNSLESGINNNNAKCPHCDQKYMKIQCDNCSTFTYLRDDQMMIEDLDCHNCHGSVSLSQNCSFNVPIVSIKSVKVDQGSKVTYDQPEPDEIELSIIDNFVKSNVYHIDSQLLTKRNYERMRQNEMKMKSDQPKNVDNTKCIICLMKKKESVFVPCGHRCTCYECGKAVVNQFHICPLCKREIKDFIPRVIDD